MASQDRQVHELQRLVRSLTWDNAAIMALAQHLRKQWSAAGRGAAAIKFLAAVRPPAAANRPWLLAHSWCWGPWPRADRVERR